MARSTPKSLASSAAAAAKKVIGRAAASTVGATNGVAKESAAPKKAPAKKARAAVKTSAKKALARKAPAKKARAAVKTSATRTSATTAPAKTKTAPAQTMPVKKAPVSNRAPTKKSAKPSSAKTAPVAKKSAKKASTSSLVVKVGEESWTKAELDEVIAELHGQRNKLAHVIEDAEAGLAGLMKDAGDGAGHDQADMGATSFERDHELTVVHIERDMVAQIDKALARIDDGTYGICEVCAEPIGKMRLMAFPRATLCLPCKQREERR